MRCSSCGADFSDDLSECPHCGCTAAAGVVAPVAVPVADPEIDTSENRVWAYSIMDLLDEACWAAIGFTICTAVYLGVHPASGVVIGAIYVIPVLYVLWQIWRYISNSLTRLYELRPSIFYFSHGFFSRKKDVLNLFTIRRMTLKQSWFQWIFGLGDIILYSPDFTNCVMKIEGIADVWNRFKILNAYRQDNQNNRILAAKKAAGPARGETRFWRYTAWDLIDEFMWTIVISVVCLWGGNLLVSCWPAFADKVNAYSWGKWAVLGAIPAVCWVCLIYAFISRRYLISYELTPTTFTRNSGLFYMKKEVFILYYVRDIQFHQNLWQRMIGVGNATLFLNDTNSPDEAEKINVSRQNWLKVEISGFAVNSGAFDLLDQYRQAELQRYSGGPH